MINKLVYYVTSIEYGNDFYATFLSYNFKTLQRSIHCTCIHIVQMCEKGRGRGSRASGGGGEETKNTLTEKEEEKVLHGINVLDII